MYSIDVRTEVRKIANSKPVHAAAGAGAIATRTLRDAIATQTLRDLPGRLARSIDGTVTSWPARANEYVQTARAKAADQTLRDLPGRLARGIDGTVTSLPARASEYVQTARAKAADQYDMLADRGKQVLGGRNDTPAKSALNGTASTGKASTSKASTSRARTTKGK